MTLEEVKEYFANLANSLESNPHKINADKVKNLMLMSILATNLARSAYKKKNPGADEFLPALDYLIRKTKTQSIIKEFIEKYRNYLIYSQELEYILSTFTGLCELDTDTTQEDYSYDLTITEPYLSFENVYNLLNIEHNSINLLYLQNFDITDEYFSDLQKYKLDLFTEKILEQAKDYAKLIKKLKKEPSGKNLSVNSPILIDNLYILDFYYYCHADKKQQNQIDELKTELKLWHPKRKVDAEILFSLNVHIKRLEKKLQIHAKSKGNKKFIYKYLVREQEIEEKLKKLKEIKENFQLLAQKMPETNSGFDQDKINQEMRWLFMQACKDEKLHDSNQNRKEGSCIIQLFYNFIQLLEKLEIYNSTEKKIIKNFSKKL